MFFVCVLYNVTNGDQFTKIIKPTRAIKVEEKMKRHALVYYVPFFPFECLSMLIVNKEKQIV